MVARNNTSLRLSNEALRKLARLRKSRGFARNSDLVEALIHEADGMPADYFQQHAAFQSFVSVAIGSQLLGDKLGADAADQFIRSAGRQAAAVFGKPPASPFPAEAQAEDMEGRVRALLEAYGVRAGP